MSRLTSSLCTLAALGMAGCTTYYDPPPTTAVTTTSGAPVVSAGSSAPARAAAASPSGYRAGSGVVESVSLTTAPAASASAGGTRPAASGPYRMTMRMDDGTAQTLLVDTRAFFVGDRLQILPDGRLIRP